MEQIWGHDYMEFKPKRWISESGDIVTNLACIKRFKTCKLRTTRMYKQM